MNKPKNKRGKQFFIVETGELVTLNRIKENGQYFCDYPNGNYASFDLSDLREVKQNKVSSIGNKPKKLTGGQKIEKKALNVFFANEILQMPFNCENCSLPLYAYTSFEKRCTIAHILEKKKFKSISTHPQNKLFLCAKGGCHAKFDNSTAKERSQMKVYNLAIERYNKIKSLLTPSEMVYAEKYLNIQ